MWFLRINLYLYLSRQCIHRRARHFKTFRLISFSAIVVTSFVICAVYINVRIIIIIIIKFRVLINFVRCTEDETCSRGWQSAFSAMQKRASSSKVFRCKWAIYVCNVFQMPGTRQRYFEHAMRSIEPNYIEHMDCRPPPIFMILISFVEVQLKLNFTLCVIIE